MVTLRLCSSSWMILLFKMKGLKLTPPLTLGDLVQTWGDNILPEIIPMRRSHDDPNNFPSPIPCMRDQRAFELMAFTFDDLDDDVQFGSNEEDTSQTIEELIDDEQGD
ncbi:hypothetical protein PROFUN_11418 [Planoprotostelium fungivorum]|uniref:Uncharacterized protein n=1 Tax=Planoprotostelium fungivorum TaxID=1890364 RepID=A0A2P6NA90_9EUKA|nr:hypothetical protein PROFUN_11418 [Planoprotostelium fungivorum]